MTDKTDKFMLEMERTISDLRRSVSSAQFMLKGKSIEECQNYFKSYRIDIVNYLKGYGELILNVLKFDKKSYQQGFEKMCNQKKYEYKEREVRKFFDQIDSNITGLIMRTLPEFVKAQHSHFEHLNQFMEKNGSAFTIWSELQ